MVIDGIDRVDGVVVIAAHPRARGRAGRRCGRVSTRVHSRYRRHLAERPVSGRPVAVRLTVRRFFCDHVECSACTFVEQFSAHPSGVRCGASRVSRSGSTATTFCTPAGRHRGERAAYRRALRIVDHHPATATVGPVGETLMDLLHRELGAYLIGTG